MFRIAVCDDNDAVCSAIENTIDGFFKTESIHYEIDSFQSGEELLEELNDHVKYDLIYLDIELAQLNGVAVGRYIRENLLDDYTQIAFISAKPSYALELFQVRPIHFLVNHLRPDRLLAFWKKLWNCKVVKSKFSVIKLERLKTEFPLRILCISAVKPKRLLFIREMEKILFMENCQN